jgi:hypothetical protein
MEEGREAEFYRDWVSNSRIQIDGCPKLKVYLKLVVSQSQECVSEVEF